MSAENVNGFVEMIEKRAKALHEHILSLPADQFKTDHKALTRAIEEFAHESGVPMLFGPPKLAQARTALAQIDPKPKVLVEFGAYVGYSALQWATILEELSGSAEGVHVYAFELSPEFAKIASDFVKLAGREHLISVIQGPGDASLKKLVADGVLGKGSVDAIFIDHWEPRYVPDLQLCEELGVLHVGSKVIADNTDVPGAPTYVAYVKAGGSGKPGAVRFTTESLYADTSDKRPRRKLFDGLGGPGQAPLRSGQRVPRDGDRMPEIVEVTTVVSLGSN